MANMTALRFRRFMTIRDLPPVPKGHCRWCGEPVPKGRRSWCSEECVEAYNVRSNPNHVQALLRRRDHGVCAHCGIDTEEVRALMRACSRKVPYKGWCENANDWGPWGKDTCRILWEADHIVPVSEGGGCCGLENYQTLCLPCHKAETARLAKRLAEARKQKRGEPVQGSFA